MVNLIAAVGKSGQIGLNGHLPWDKNKEDLKWFQQLTMGGLLIVGYNTYQNLPPLPGRALYCMERLDTPEDLMRRFNKQNIWIAGGAKTYEIWIPYVERFYISRIDYDGPADTFFPFETLTKKSYMGKIA